jgi:DNA-binding beta-propeller fold protein YncE
VRHIRRWVVPLLSVLAVTGTAHAQGPSYAVTSRIALPDGGWDLASFDPTLRRVYLARSEGVTAIDVETGAVTGRLAPANGGHAAVPSKTGRELLVTSGKSNTADIVDARTGARLASLQVGEKPDAAMIEPTTGLGVVMNAKSGSLSLVDVTARRVVGTIPVGGSLELGAADGTGRIFVNIEDRNELVAVDLKSRTVQKRFALTGCDGPTGAAWLPVSRRVLSTCGNGVAAVTDPATGKVETVPIGQGPDTALYDASRKIAFVPAGRSGELDLFDDTPQGVKPAGKIATQRGARTGALDPRSGRIYLAAAEYASPSDAGARPQIVPGSVVLVIVSPSR